MFDYKVYTQIPGALSLAEAEAIYQRLAPETHRDDEDFMLLWSDLLAAASNYVATRNRWVVMTAAERQAADASRSKQHNNFMACLQPLGRLVAPADDQDWLIAALGDRQQDPTKRKRWGDFAGYLLLFGTLAGR
ncbi:hypothetical protein [Lacticaseibacillus sp. GG6-2]